MKTLTKILREHVEENGSRIWGYFSLSDGTRTQFECKKRDLERLGDGAWFQWGNTTENLWLSVERVEQLVGEWQATIGPLAR